MMGLALFVEYTTGPFGSLNAILFFALTVLTFLLHMRRTLGIMARYWLVLPWPFFMLASTLWSAAPDLTLRFSCEMIATVVAGLFMGAVLEGWALERVVMLGSGALVIGSLPYVPLALASRLPLLAFFGSKNIEAFISHTAFAACLPIAVFGRGLGRWRLAALILAPLSVVTLWLAQSAGANVSMGITLGVFCAGALYMATPRQFRLLVILTVVIAVLMMLPLLPTLQLAWKDFQQNVLHKDETLTGRTYLWDFAKGLIAERPVLGAGAGSFWRVGNIDAEGLWSRYKIFNQYGFTFHNTFIETTVSTGYVGLATFVAVLVWVAVRVILSFLRRPDAVNLWLLAYLTAWYARLGTEVLVGACSPETTLLVAAGVVVSDRVRRRRKKPRRQWRPPTPGRAMVAPASATDPQLASPGTAAT